ncbi:hypothetical protein DTO012A7_7391 [Penicillium roqueforti]|nr:hypothetical protein CBS147355_9670 [Penicillium roqueforti]KAI2673610.1 hypothetical protein LCP963914a_9056 [Penicillium roqueforti]KAI2700182.1 hypothetical protein CBS147372_5799 [Penicillium roqueforti]KAI3124285.1 hypothetical protein CBS147326_8115 [Penicillium roqueforti]KAI3158888.1 hypothetical protein DTO039G3_9624 [Penicillium roqueforti]
MLDANLRGTFRFGNRGFPSSSNESLDGVGEVGTTPIEDESMPVSQKGLTNRLLRPLNRVEPGLSSASMGHCPSEKEMCWIFYIVGSVSIWRGLNIVVRYDTLEITRSLNYEVFVIFPQSFSAIICPPFVYSIYFLINTPHMTVTMGKMRDNSFHYFMRLPLELRRIIWMHCLPYRIAEEDIPECLFNGCESNQACDTRKTMKQNAQQPTITFVNSESWLVALEQGQILKSVEINTLESIWVQPHRDVLHLNWIRLYYTIWGVDHDAPGRADEFLLHAKDLGMRPSVMAELIHPFNLKAVLDGGDGSDPPGDLSPFHIGVSVMPVLPYHCIEGDDMREMVDVLPWAKGQRSMLDIAMAGVSLHITREAALRSGLFGLLGDAPVQMIDVDDRARLREFEALFREHTLEKEPAVQKLFDAFTSSRFQKATEKWKKKLNGISWLTCGSRHETESSAFLGRTRVLLGYLTCQRRRISACLSIYPMRGIRG